MPAIASGHTAWRRRVRSTLTTTVWIKRVGARFVSLRRRARFRRFDLLIWRVAPLASCARHSRVGPRRLSLGFEMAHARHLAMLRSQGTALVELAPLAPAPRDVQDDYSGRDQHDDRDDHGGMHVSEGSLCSSSRHLASGRVHCRGAVVPWSARGRGIDAPDGPGGCRPRSARARIRGLERLDQVGADRERCAAVVLAADEVECRLRCAVTTRATPAEAIEDLGATARQDLRSRRGGVQREELPVVGGRAEAGGALDHRFLRDQLEDGADRVPTPLGRPGDGKSLIEVAPHVGDEVVAHQGHGVDVRKVAGNQVRVLRARRRAEVGPDALVPCEPQATNSIAVAARTTAHFVPAVRTERSRACRARTVASPPMHPPYAAGCGSDCLRT